MPDELSTLVFVQLLANANRLRVVSWLADPTAHFPPQRDGDLVDDGVCLGAIARKLGVSQPTTTRHLQALADAGLVHGTRIGTWVFYRLDVEAYRQAADRLAALTSARGTGRVSV